MKALVVDDEQYCRDNLKWMLENYCPEIQAIQTAAGAEEARKLLAGEEPDVLFLDIQMPKEDGLTFLEKLGERKFSVIFTTAHNEYALKALKLHAFDYIEKPISMDELRDSVAALKRQNGHRKGTSISEVRALVREAAREQAEDRIAIPLREGIEIVHVREIVHLEASESYTVIHLESGSKVLSSKNIKVYEDKLDPDIFFRIHKSHIVNMRHHLRGMHRIDGNDAVMSNGRHIPISRRKVQPFLDRISRL